VTGQKQTSFLEEGSQTGRSAEEEKKSVVEAERGIETGGKHYGQR